MKRFFIFIFTYILYFSSCFAETDVKVNYFKFGTSTNPEGISLLVDSKGFIVGGKRVLPVMGEIHYSRVPAKDWEREILKMKAGGAVISLQPK